MKPRRLLVLLALGCAFTGACSGGDFGGNDDAATAEATALAGDSGGAVVGSGEVAAPALPSGRPLQAGRDLIQRADISIRVDDVDGAAASAVTFAEDRGGFLSGQELARNEQGATGTVELRVPSESFEDLLDQLAGLGDVLTRHVDTDDVTDQVVDLQARLTTAQASVERVRALLADAQSVDEIVRLEGEVSARETTVEQLTGQLNVLRDQVALSSITVRLGEVVPPPPETDPQVSDDIPGFGSGLDHGWVAFQDMVGVLLTVVGALLPFAAVGVPIALVVRWLRRRFARPAA
jgi:hypothetical protein